jgi:hypothetical protein
MMPSRQYVRATIEHGFPCSIPVTKNELPLIQIVRRNSDMSAYYSMHGTVRVQASPDVDGVVARIREHCDRDFEVALVPVDSEISVFSIEGAGEFSSGGVLALDQLIVSLGPHAVEAAVFTSDYENEPCELVVAPTPETGFTALSRHRLDQIKPALRELTAEDKKSLVALLTDQGT